MVKLFCLCHLKQLVRTENFGPTVIITYLLTYLLTHLLTYLLTYSMEQSSS